MRKHNGLIRFGSMYAFPQRPRFGPFRHSKEKRSRSIDSQNLGGQGCEGLLNHSTHCCCHSIPSAERRFGPLPACPSSAE